MQNWVIFYFLWDDPLFTNASSIEEWELKDPEFIELRRKLRLTHLDWLYAKIKILEQRLIREKELHRKDVAREFWTSTRLLNILEVTNPKEVLQILIDRKVNEMDPDFSFEKAISQ